MSIISLIRLLTLATAVPYSLEQIDYDAIAMWMDRGLAIITETGYSWVFTAGTIGVYIWAGSAVAVAGLASCKESLLPLPGLRRAYRIYHERERALLMSLPFCRC